MSVKRGARHAQKSQFGESDLFLSTTRTVPMLDRRQLLASLAAAGISSAAPRLASAQGAPLLTRPIPSSGEQIPVVGLGSWRTFNVGNNPEARDTCAEVMRAFFGGGGRMIDSWPMYGSSQDTIGYGLKKLDAVDKVFAADKVWTYSGGAVQSDLAQLVSSLACSCQRLLSLPPVFVLEVSEPLC
jgi:hypothetical protein